MARFSLSSVGHTPQTQFTGAAMPFDGASFARSEHDVLETAVYASGLRPIDPRFLDCHKAEQVRRNPASWAYRHQQVVALAQVAVLLASVGLFVVMLSAHEVPWGFVAGLAMFALGSAALFLPVKGPALWRERETADLSVVPAVIRQSAEQLQHRLPGVGFVLGELYQEKVRLDPYLVAQYCGSRVVLGIWDGDRVVACA
ncbi:MAG TPA: hypothetical protein VGI28_14535 [Stellaceae bacterium]|jgi:hypothetical protein